MKKIFFIISLVAACNTKNHSNDQSAGGAEAKTGKDTLTYAYKALYSSDISVPSNPEYAQKVLTVWKMFESNQIEAMRPYWADTITYHDANGLNFHGSVDALLNIAKKDIEELDSLRFDLIVWQSEHINDRNEDWVRIWARERRYSSKAKADTSLIQENWQINNGRIIYFDQYKAALPK